MFSKNINTSKYIFIFFIAGLNIFIFNSKTFSAIPQLTIHAPTEVKNVNVIFDVSVTIDNWEIVNDIGGATAYITFDPNYLEVVDVGGQLISELNNSAEFEIPVTNLVNNNAGTIYFGAITMGLGKNSGATLVSFKMKTKKMGSASLNFFKTNCEVLLNYSDIANKNYYTLMPEVNTATINIGDFTPPTISNITVIDITRSSATITFATSEAALNKISYGKLDTNENSTLQTTDLATSHSVTLTGLSANTSYSYFITVIDEFNNSSKSDTAVFITTNEDKSPPIITHIPITITSNANNLNFLAKITDDVEVKQATLHYKNENENYQIVSLVNQGNDIYAYTLPSSSITSSKIEYYLSASDTSDNFSYQPTNYNTSPYTISIKYETGNITGRVYNANNLTGISNAVINIIGTGIFTNTNSDGSYTLSNVPTGTYTLEVTATGFVSKTQKDVPVSLNTTTSNIDFSLDEASTITGTVKNAYSVVTISNAIITITEINTNISYFGKTDENGNFTITSIPQGTYNISTEKIGYYSDKMENIGFLPGQTVNVNIISLQPKEIIKIILTPYFKALPSGETFTFSAKGYTDDNAVININPIFEVSPSWVGKIDTGGNFTAADGNNEGQIIARVMLGAKLENGATMSTSVIGRAKVTVSQELTLLSINTGGKPFNPYKESTMRFRYQLSQDPIEVVIKIYTMQGYLIRTLYANNFSSQGYIDWDGKDSSGKLLPNGVYVYQLSAKSLNKSITAKPKMVAIFKNSN